MKKNLEKEVIFSRLRELKNSLYYIKEYLPSDVSFLEDRKSKNALYKEVEFAIQLAIDICVVINSSLSKTTPFNEDSIFISLEKEKVLSHVISKKLIIMKGFRNLLVHRYGDIDDNTAYESISNGIKDFDTFIKEIEKFLAKHSSQDKLRK